MTYRVYTKDQQIKAVCNVVIAATEGDVDGETIAALQYCANVLGSKKAADELERQEYGEVDTLEGNGDTIRALKLAADIAKDKGKYAKDAVADIKRIRDEMYGKFSDQYSDGERKAAEAIAVNVGLPAKSTRARI